MRETNLIDLTGQTFGIWRVEKQAPREDNKTRWLCRCNVCGATVSHRSTALRKGVFERCDGRHLRRVNAPSRLRKPDGYAAATETYSRIKAQARKRGLAFSLSRDEVVAIAGQPCHYCGCVPAQRAYRRHFNGAFVYNGLDRKDSAGGYEKDNCVAACGTCNVMKQDLSEDSFLNHVALIYSLRFLGVNSALRPSPRMAFGLGGNKGTAQISNPSRIALSERCSAAQALRASGRTISQIGEQLNLSRTSVYRALSNHSGSYSHKKEPIP